MSIVGLTALQSKVKIEGIIELTSGLHIGVGRSLEPVGTNSPVLKDFTGAPYIPGSSFKGPFRAAVEAVVRGAGFPQDKLWCCNVLGNDEEKCIYRKEDIYHAKTGKTKKADESGVEEFLWKNSCDICRLFGSPFIASRLKVPDMRIKSESGWKETMFEIRDGVAIDRDSETKKSGALYDFEVVPPGTQFEFKMIVDNPENWELDLLLNCLDMFNKRYVSLGGIKSRGLGTIKITLISLVHETAKSLLGEEKPDVVQGDVAIREKYKKALTDYLKQGGGNV